MFEIINQSKLILIKTSRASWQANTLKKTSFFAESFIRVVYS